MKVIHKAMFFLLEDETATPQQAIVIEHKGSLWLVATWLQSNDTAEKIPERIVPMEKLPYRTKSDGLIVLAQTIPKELFAHDARIELLKEFEAATLPVLAHIQTRAQTH